MLALRLLPPISVRVLYQVVAPIYDPLSMVWRRWLYPAADRVFDHGLAAHLPPNGDVLDLGCGTGANLERLRALGLPFRSYTGLDASTAMLDRARAKFRGVPGVRFERRDLLADPLPDGPFDLVVSTYVFEHLANPVGVVHRAWARLRAGGHMLLLFETDAPSLRVRLVDPILRTFSARRLPGDVLARFPGAVRVARFTDGAVAVVTLAKPPDHATTRRSMP